MKKDEDKHPVKAIMITILYLLIFVGTAVFITFLTFSYAETGYFFKHTALFAAGIGLPLSILAGLTAYYDKGTKKRLIFGFVSGALLLIYFVAVINSLNIGWEGDEYVYQITIPGILILIVITVFLRLIYYGLEYRIYNKKDNEGVTYY